jgi:molybdate transport system permease protein
VSEAELSILLLSLKVAGVALVVTLPVALAIAYTLARCGHWVTYLLNIAVHLPLVLPPVVTGYVLLILFGRRGLIGASLEKIGIVFAFDWTGAALAAGVMALPLIVRPMRVAIEAVDTRLEDAARTMGANPLMVFWTTTLPLALPGIVAGAITGFAKSLGEFGATITFVSSIPGETETIPLAIHGLLQIPGQDIAVLRLCLLAFLIAVVAVAASEFATSRIRRRVIDA